MNKYFLTAIILFITFLGTGLRIYNLEGSPPSLNWDEAAWGYNAYSILRTGRDEYGKFMPIFTRSFDEYKSTLPLYFMVPSILIFGLTEFAIRLPSAFVGALIIPIMYLLVNEISKNKEVSILSAVVIATSPWAIHLSRVYYDANMALFFLLAGMFLLLKSQKHGASLIPASIFFVLSTYTYNSNKILTPLVAVSMVYLLRKKIARYKRPHRVISAVTVGLGGAVFVYLTLIGQALARTSSTNVFVLWEGLPKSISLLFLNNPFYMVFWEITGRYWAYFSPPNLFTRIPLEPSTIVPGTSVFEPVYFFPWIIGLIYILVKPRQFKTLLTLIILAPIPAALTWNWFQPGRALALFAAYCAVIAVGISVIFSWIAKKSASFVKLLLYLEFTGYVIFSTFYVFDAINSQLPSRVPGNWQPGFSEVVPTVMRLEHQYKKVVIDTPHAQPYIFYLFYGQYDPARYLQELDQDAIGTPRKSFDFGKFEFRHIYWPDDKDLQKTLFVGGTLDYSEQIEEGVDFRKDIDHEDGYSKTIIIGNN